MFKLTHFLVLISVPFFAFYFVANAGNYLDGVLLRAEGDIKVYLINNNIKKWVSSIEVFNNNNFKWQEVKVVPAKDITAIEEGEPIVLEQVSPSSSKAPIASISPAAPISPKINYRFPYPDYIRADWLISRITADYGRVGQKIVFKYSNKEADKIENFRLYEKKPGDAYFNKVADFEGIISVFDKNSPNYCGGESVDGEWTMLESGQCGYWFIQRTELPGGRAVYLPLANYSVGEYSYYVAGVDKDGSETLPSPEAKLVFLNPVDVLSPINNQQTNGIYPTFKWSVVSGWPMSSVPDYFISISDNDSAQNPFWGKQIKVPARLSDGQEGKSDESFTYDGLGLDPTKKYKVYVYGHYRKSEYDPDYISVPFNVPEFQVKLKTSAKSFVGLFRALFVGTFDLLR